MTAESSSLSLVFLYGTLKSGFPNTHLNPAIRIDGDFSTVEPYPFYIVTEFRFPCLLDQPGAGHQVKGEMYRASDQDLEHFDKLERVGEPEGYVRKSIKVVESQSREVYEAYVYMIPEDRFVKDDMWRGPLPEYTAEDAATFRIPDDWAT